MPRTPGVAARDDGAVLRCALVNNMPDAAFGHTERQFYALLAGIDDARDVEVSRFSLPGVPRSPDVARRIETEYFPIESLADSEPDVVIVTGTEPLAAHLADEPYWPALEHLLRWCQGVRGSVILSCLAAHAGLLAYDGIERRRLEQKRTGVFTQEPADDDPLLAGLDETVLVPHSRVNDVARRDIEAHGYATLLGSDEVGWSVAVRREGDNEIVLIQGHPEYDATSLLREYRRDVERYLSGASRTPPVLPRACVAPKDEPFLRAYHERILGSAPDPALLADLHFDDLLQRVTWPWRPAALRFYDNWLEHAAGRSLARQGKDSDHRAR